MLNWYAVRQELKKARNERGLTQEQAAKLSGVGVKSLASFEGMYRVPCMKVVQLAKLLEAYSVSLPVFFDRVAENKDVSPSLRWENLGKRREKP